MICSSRLPNFDVGSSTTAYRTRGRLFDDMSLGSPALLRPWGQYERDVAIEDRRSPPSATRESESLRSHSAPGSPAERRRLGSRFAQVYSTEHCSAFSLRLVQNVLANQSPIDPLPDPRHSRAC